MDMSPFYKSIENHNLKELTQLCAKNKKLDVPNDQYYYPLHFAIQKGFLDFVKLLIGNGANINYNYKESPFAAIRNRDFELVKILVEKGIPINIVNNRNERPLHIAIKGKNGQIADFLLHNNANPDVPGNLCLPLAHKVTNLQISTILSSRGAKEDLRTPRSSRNSMKINSSRQEAIEKRNQINAIAEDGRCAICQTTEDILYIIPCYHRVICKNCLENIDMLLRCPICHLSFMGATETPP